MINEVKKVLSFLCCVVLIFTMSGCGFNTVINNSNSNTAQEDVTLDSNSEIVDTEKPNNTDNESTGITLSPEVENCLTSLETDYNKIAWGVKYSIFDDYPAFVISVTPYSSKGKNYLVVALTNLYSDDISFSGDALAYDVNNSEIGPTHFSVVNIGTGSTVLQLINCEDGIPDGRIHWSDCAIEIAEKQKYIPWESDYTASGNADKGCLTVSYSIYAQDNKDMIVDDVSILLLDKSGYVIGVETDHVSDVVVAGSQLNDSIDICEDISVLNLANDIAMFANPIGK